MGYFKMSDMGLLQIKIREMKELIKELNNKLEETQIESKNMYDKTKKLLELINNKEIQINNLNKENLEFNKRNEELIFEKMIEHIKPFRTALEQAEKNRMKTLQSDVNQLKSIKDEIIEGGINQCDERVVGLIMIFMNTLNKSLIEEKIISSKLKLDPKIFIKEMVKMDVM